jgi:hypothetical protein
MCDESARLGGGGQGKSLGGFVSFSVNFRVTWPSLHTALENAYIMCELLIMAINSHSFC